MRRVLALVSLLPPNLDLLPLPAAPASGERNSSSCSLDYPECTTDAGTIEQADAENAPAILETQNEKNVAMYTKMGFEVRDLIHVESSRVETSPFWFMGRGFWEGCRNGT